MVRRPRSRHFAPEADTEVTEYLTEMRSPRAPIHSTALQLLQLGKHPRSTRLRHEPTAAAVAAPGDSDGDGLEDAVEIELGQTRPTLTLMMTG